MFIMKKVVQIYANRHIIITCIFTFKSRHINTKFIDVVITFYDKLKTRQCQVLKQKCIPSLGKLK